MSMMGPTCLANSAVFDSVGLLESSSVMGAAMGGSNMPGNPPRVGHFVRMSSERASSERARSDLVLCGELISGTWTLSLVGRQLSIVKLVR